MLSKSSFPLLLCLLAAGPVRAQPGWEPSSDVQQFFALPVPTRLQVGFSLGSQLEASGSVRPDFAVGGSPPDAVKAGSRLRPGFGFTLKAGGLGPKGWHGGFLELNHRSQAVRLGDPGVGLGQLSMTGAYLVPTLGMRFPAGAWSLRPELHFGAGYEWTRFDPSDPSLLPAAASTREYGTGQGFAWKAGAGVDVHWHRCCALSAVVERLGHDSSIAIRDAASGVELGRLALGLSAWAWRVGLVYGY